MAGANKDDGTNPEAHIWKIAPTRRDMIGFIGWGGVLTGLGLGSAAFIRMLYPRVLFEPPTMFKLGKPNDYSPNAVADKWIKAYRFWLIRFSDRFIAVSAICTHLGCTPRYLTSEDKFKCPCHGSGYRGMNSGWKVIATNFEGPAPRPMERFKLTLAEDGQIQVDKSVTYRIEKDEAAKPGAFLPYA
jgi:cytochrome b6-f complex iron-sulfur subunit